MNSNPYARFLARYEVTLRRRLPLISPHVAALESRSLEAGQLLGAFESDPCLAARLCAEANSIFFDVGHHPILTVGEALERVGDRHAAQLLQSLSGRPSLPWDSSKALWLHSTNVARIARSIIERAANAPFSPNTGTLIGLIADIGYLVSATSRGIPCLSPRLHETENVCGPLGCDLLAAWGLPPLVLEVLKASRNLQIARSPEARFLASVLQVAQVLSRGLPLSPHADAQALECLGNSGFHSEGPTEPLLPRGPAKRPGRLNFHSSDWGVSP